MCYKYNSTTSKWPKYNIIIRNEQINETENEELVINETIAKTQQDEQEEETDGPLNEHRAPTKETCIQVVIIDHENVSTGNEI